MQPSYDGKHPSFERKEAQDLTWFAKMLALQFAFNITPEISQAEHVGVFSKLGGKLLGWIAKPRLDFDLSRKDTSILLRDMQRQVGRFFKHPCRSFRHILLFAGSVQLVPDEFAYDTELSSTNLAKLHSELRMATRVEVVWNYDDGPACWSIVASRLAIGVVKSELRVAMLPQTLTFVQDVLLMPALDVVNSNDVVCVQSSWSRDNYVKLSCLKSPRPIKSIIVLNGAKTFGGMQCFEQAKTLAICSTLSKKYKVVAVVSRDCKDKALVTQKVLNLNNHQKFYQI